MTTPSGLWAEGDSLTPTNLNRRNPVGTFPAKTYHVAWAAGTGTTQINNAIVNAATGGYTAVFVDASRFGYDASAVTFNNAIPMLCEGQTEGDVDARAYGLGGASDYAALTAALASGRAVTGPGGTIAQLSQPLLLTSGQNRIAGPRRGATGDFSIRSNGYAYGPIICGAGSHTIGTGTALATGVGNSLALGSLNLAWLNLRDAATCDLDGLTAFTARCFFKPGASTGDGHIIGSDGGGFLYGDSRTIAFHIGVNAGVYRAILTTSGSGQKVITSSTAPVAGTTVVLALNYNGSTFDFRINGTSVGTQAMTGTISQGLHEDVTIGCGVQFNPDGTNITNMAGGASSLIDSVELANVARDISGNPTAKFSADANTLMLCNFDLQSGPMTRGHTKNGDAWLVVRNPDSAVGGADVELDHLQLISGTNAGATGIFLCGQSYRPKLNDIRIRNCRNGILAPKGNTYQWAWRNVFIDNFDLNAVASARFGIHLGSNSGIGHLDSCTIIGFAVPFISTAAIALTVNNLWIQCLQESIYGVIVRATDNHNGYVFSGINIDCEGASNASYRASIALSATAGLPLTATFHAAVIESQQNQPPILIDKADSVLFDVPIFTTYGTAASIVTRLRAPVQPIIMTSPVLGGAFTPLANQNGDVAVILPGTLASTSTGGTVLFDASKYGQWDLTLTSDVTQSSWSKINYGQPVSGAIKMDSTGSRLFVWPTNSKGTATLSYGSAAINTFSGFYDGVNVILTSVRTGL